MEDAESKSTIKAIYTLNIPLKIAVIAVIDLKPRSVFLLQLTSSVIETELNR